MNIWNLEQLATMEEEYLKRVFSGSIAKLAVKAAIEGFILWLKPFGSGFTIEQLQGLAGQYINSEFKNSIHRATAEIGVNGWLGWLARQEANQKGKFN